jgi:hypothetical protein
MPIYPLKNLVSNKLPLLLLLMLLLHLLNGCSVSMFNGYHRNGADAGFTPVSWFQSDTGYYLFNTNIDLIKNHFSGLMVIKPMTGGIYRVVFMTEVGLKIFDMEYFPDKPVRVHYIMDAMNRKALVNVLSNDISLMLMNRFAGVKPDLLNKKTSGDLVFRFRDKGRKYYYHVAENDGKPYKVLQTGRIVNKVNVNFYGSAASGIDSVIISHYNLRLSLGLYRINKEANNVAE